MGTDKASLPFAQATLWEHQLRTLQSLAPSELLISGPASGPYSGAGYPILEDELPDCGPLSGILSGLRRMQHPFLLVLAIDLPDITPDFLQKLVSEAQAKGKGIVAKDSKWWQPLAAVYPKTILPIAEECLRQADRSMQHFIRLGVEHDQLCSRDLTTDEQLLFRNINTPMDL